MFGEYGYMEEGKLGKPYNIRMLKRLAHYAAPYKKTIVTALLLSLLLTLSSLALPYLSKIAIDRYILSSWYRIDMGRQENPCLQNFLSRYGHFLKKSTGGAFGFISHSDMKNIDPADLHACKAHGILFAERFYKTGPDVQTGIESGMGEKTVVMMVDGSKMVPYEVIDRLSKENIIKIRAGDLRGVTLVAALALILLVFSFTINCAEYYLLEFTGQHIMQDIRLRLFGKMQSYTVRFFDRNPVGRLVTRVTNDIENLNEMFKSVVVTVFKDFFVLSGILVILLYLNWRLAIISFTLIPFIFGLTFLFSKMAREAFRELRATVARINVFLQERITGMRVIQLSVREKFQMETFSRMNHENFSAGMRQIRVFAIFMPIMELFSSFAVALLIWQGGAKVIGEQLTLGTLVAFISYIQMFFKPIRDISEKYNIMQSAMASAERIFEFMDHKEDIPEARFPQIPPEKKGHLVFENISFAYEEGRPVLQNISFEVKPGETVAIVGATGAGKTTLVNLVTRFYDPDEGAILLDGIDLRKWPKSELRKSISMCMQDVFIFSGNLVDNISLGREDISADAVELAASRANALPFINRLENHFQQEIGEGGATLSTGERQLLSFARALASDPQVLILDEATSSVDPETERLIQKAISRMAARRTTLVVAHRLSTIRGADRILVMHKGSICEQGTHEELMSLGGIYSKLNRLGNLASGS
ncbi:MAG: ABC transporter ATP-binding protein [Deltaproteobacteria bacterium]|nr:ABC transporter ATP-binding protein [Deltaproteobacteria bacterium]